MESDREKRELRALLSPPRYRFTRSVEQLYPNSESNSYKSIKLNRNKREETQTTAVHNQLQAQRFSLDGKDDVVTNILHTNSSHESVHSDTVEQNDFESKTPTILFKIYEEVDSHRKGNTSIKTYFKNLKAIWDHEPASTFTQSSSDAIVEQSEFMEREKLMQFLMGLNVSYSSICSQIFLLSPSRSVEEAYTLILREQKNRKLVKKNRM